MSSYSWLFQASSTLCQCQCQCQFILQGEGYDKVLSYTEPHLHLAALSSQTGPAFSLGRSRPSPHARPLTRAAIQAHVAAVCR